MLEEPAGRRKQAKGSSCQAAIAGTVAGAIVGSLALRRQRPAPASGRSGRESRPPIASSTEAPR